MDIMNLKARLTLDDQQYKTGMNEAKAETKSFEQETSNMSRTSVIKWAAVAAAVTMVVNKMKQAIVETLNYADAMTDLSAQYGVTIEAIGELQYIGSQASAELEQILTSMSMMYMRAKENDEAFAKLGVSVYDMNGQLRNMDDLFWEVQERLSEMTNEGEQSAMMLDLFGRSAMQIGEVLRMDAEDMAALRQGAHDLGIVLEEEVARGASDFNDMLAEMKLRGQSAFASLIMGADNGMEMFENFLNDVMGKVEEYLPRFITLTLETLKILAKAVMRALPSVVAELIDALIQFAVENLLSFEWISVGLQIGWELLKGIAKVLGALIGYGWLWGTDSSETAVGAGNVDASNIPSLPSGSFETITKASASVDVNITANGTSEVDEENAELIAKKLAPYINQEIGKEV